MNPNEKKMHELFEKLVPASGKSDSLAGEIVRAFSRLEYRYYNDGDRLGIGYGKETCNAAGRFLEDTGNTNRSIADTIQSLREAKSDSQYEEILNDLRCEILELLDGNQALAKTPTKDFWDYFDRDEDRDDDPDCGEGYEEDEEWQ